MPDSSAIDAALVGKLQGDAALMTLMPDGAFMDVAGPSIVNGGDAKRFVIVSLVTAFDEPQFGGRSFEDVTYLVKAVGFSVVNATPLPANAMKDAAARIDALLDGGTLTAAGYALMTMRRVERIRLTEIDEVDSSHRWYHRGGHYQVVMSL